MHDVMMMGAMSRQVGGQVGRQLEIAVAQTQLSDLESKEGERKRGRI